MKNNNYEEILNMTIGEIENNYPMAFDFFLNYNLSYVNKNIIFKDLIESLNDEFYINFGMEKKNYILN